MVFGGVKFVYLYWLEVFDNDVMGYWIFRIQDVLIFDIMLEELVDVSGKSKIQFVDGVDNSKLLLDGEEYYYFVVVINKFGGVGVVFQI